MKFNHNTHTHWDMGYGVLLAVIWTLISCGLNILNMMCKCLQCPPGVVSLRVLFPASGAREIRCICGHKKTLQIREPHAFDIRVCPWGRE